MNAAAFIEFVTGKGYVFNRGFWLYRCTPDQLPWLVASAPTNWLAAVLEHASPGKPGKALFASYSKTVKGAGEILPTKEAAPVLAKALADAVDVSADQSWSALLGLPMRTERLLAAIRSSKKRLWVGTLPGEHAGCLRSASRAGTGWLCRS